MSTGPHHGDPEPHTSPTSDAGDHQADQPSPPEPRAAGPHDVAAQGSSAVPPSPVDQPGLGDQTGPGESDTGEPGNPLAPAASALEPNPEDVGASQVPWQRISPWHLLVSMGGNLPSILVAIFAWVTSGGTGWLVGVAVVAGIGALLTVVGSFMEYLQVRYRIRGNTIERQAGLVSRSKVKVPVDRVRTVNIEQSFAQKIFRVSTVEIITGADSFKINGVKKSAAESFKTDLDTHPARQTDTVTDADLAAIGLDGLPTAPGAATSGHTNPSEPGTDHAQPATLPAADDRNLIAKIHWKWPLFAGIRGPGLIPVFALVGTLLSQGFNTVDSWITGRAESYIDQIIEDTDQATADANSVRDIALTWLQDPRTYLILAGLLVILAVLSYLANVIGYILVNYNFTLRRLNASTLTRSAGLFSTRTSSIDIDRLRGVALKDTPIYRRIGYASSEVMLTTGAATLDSSPALLPWSPRPINERVTDDLLTTPGEHRVPLQPHGPKAARRLLLGATRSAIVLTGIAAAVLWFNNQPFGWLIVMAPIAFCMIGHAYLLHRMRGNELTNEHFITQYGFFHRTKRIVQRRAALGVRIERSPLQRLIGIADFTMMDSDSGQHALDVTEQRAMDLANNLAPDLIAQFAVSTSHSPAESAQPPVQG